MEFMIQFDEMNWQYAQISGDVYAKSSIVQGERSMRFLFDSKIKFAQFCTKMYEIGGEFTIRSMPE